MLIITILLFLSIYYTLILFKYLNIKFVEHSGNFSISIRFILFDIKFYIKAKFRIST